MTERSRAMLIDSNLPKELWLESINVAIHVINQSPTTPNPGKVFAYKHFMTTLSQSVKPRLNRIQIFRAMAYVHIPPEMRPKGGEVCCKSSHWLSSGIH